MTQAEIAKKVNRSKGYISRLIHRHETPSVELSIDLEAAVGGKISAEDWLAAKPARMRRLWADYKSECKMEELRERLGR